MSDELPVLPDQEEMMKTWTKPPEWFVDLISEALAQWGPDGHRDGDKQIATLAWNKARGTLMPCPRND